MDDTCFLLGWEYERGVSISISISMIEIGLELELELVWALVSS